jgi:hypothetical protein
VKSRGEARRSLEASLGQVLRRGLEEKIGFEARTRGGARPRFEARARGGAQGEGSMRGNKFEASRCAPGEAWFRGEARRGL